MMVADASVVVSYLLKTDPYNIATEIWMDKFILTKQTIVAPTLLLPEVSGPVTRRTKTSSQGQAAINIVLNLPNLRLIYVTRKLAIEAATLAADLELRGADAIYVAIARRFKVPLITWDNDHINKTKGVITAYTPLTAP
jgi:predicted nucleic acid-binding protein